MKEFLIFAIENQNHEYLTYYDKEWNEWFFPWLGFPTYDSLDKAEATVHDWLLTKRSYITEQLEAEGFYCNNDFCYIGSLKITKPHHNNIDEMEKYRFHVITASAMLYSKGEFKSLKELSLATKSNQSLIGFLRQYQEMKRSA